MVTELLDRLEGSAALDQLAQPWERAVRPLVRAEPAGRILSGAWLGHRLHPMLAVGVLGAWLSASILDMVGGKAARSSARQLVGIGIAAALPTVAAGQHDWVDQPAKVRRSGVVHALINVVGLTLQVASWRARRRHHHRQGARLSMAAIAAAGAGGYIGGHLTYVLGAGVERTAFDRAPEEWTAALPVEELGEAPRAVDVGGTAVLLVRDGERTLAMADTCNHLGCSLAEGEIVDGAVTCRCHGSRFRLADGATLAGPAAAPQPTYETRVRDGIVEVRERQHGGA
jgi:nitrite reductase/ring-hydroxylating ferredoxin subunit/fluoride ion exporter CrcB/FEX